MTAKEYEHIDQARKQPIRWIRCHFVHYIGTFLYIVSKKFLGRKSLVKISSVTAEILLIWTNVARSNVICTNVTMTVHIC